MVQLQAQQYSKLSHWNQSCRCNYIFSEGWEGRVSDEQITLESGFFNIVNAGDCVLADCRFLTEENLSRKGAYMSMPKFAKGRRNCQLQMYTLQGILPL